jgi:hypothetical protein
MHCDFNCKIASAVKFQDELGMKITKGHVWKMYGSEWSRCILFNQALIQNK